MGEAVEEQSNEVKRLADELNELRALLVRENAPKPIELPENPPQQEPETPTQQEPVVPEEIPEPTPPVKIPEPQAPEENTPTPPQQKPEPAPNAPQQVIEHSVQPGETLTAISAKYGMTWQKIAEANNITDPKLIRVGQKLKIPTSKQQVTANKPVETPPAPTPPKEIPKPVEQAKAPGFVTVASGDTLSSIARRHNTTVAALIAANPGIAPERIQVGQKINLAPGASSQPQIKRAVQMSTHIVQEGETLSSIARTYGTTTAALVALNQLPDSGHIRIGQKLQVPKKPEPTSAHPTPLPLVPEPIANDKLVPYEVKAGETLYGIGRKFFLGVDEIAEMNNISSNSELRAGQEILVPMHALYSRSVAPVSDLKELR